jgi:hypothetical protein
VTEVCGGSPPPTHTHIDEKIYNRQFKCGLCGNTGHVLEYRLHVKDPTLYTQPATLKEQTRSAKEDNRLGMKAAVAPCV